MKITLLSGVDLGDGWTRVRTPVGLGKGGAKIIIVSKSVIFNIEKRN